MRITLNPNNPYCRQYIARNEQRYNAMAALLVDDLQPYIEWHKATVGNGQESVMAEVWHRWAKAIKDGGYSEEAGQAEAKALDRTWQAPRVSVWSDGRLDLEDGNHRVLTMLALGRPIEADVFDEHKQWLSIMRHFSKVRPYQEIMHPVLHATTKGVIRRQSYSRYRTIIDAATALVEIDTVRELGCSEGVGLLALADAIGPGKVTATESDPPRWYIARSLCGDAAKVECTDKMGRHKPDLYVCLSVLHHMCRTPAEAATVAAKLAKAKAVAVELPEPGSQTWSPEMLKHPCPESIIEDALAAAGLVRTAKLYSDQSYAGRVTWLWTHGG